MHNKESHCSSGNKCVSLALETQFGHIAQNTTHIKLPYVMSAESLRWKARAPPTHQLSSLRKWHRKTCRARIRKHVTIQNVSRRIARCLHATPAYAAQKVALLLNPQRMRPFWGVPSTLLPRNHEVNHGRKFTNQERRKEGEGSVRPRAEGVGKGHSQHAEGMRSRSYWGLRSTHTRQQRDSPDRVEGKKLP